MKLKLNESLQNFTDKYSFNKNWPRKKPGKPSLGCYKKYDNEKHWEITGKFQYEYVLHEFLKLNLGSHIVTQLPKQVIHASTLTIKQLTPLCTI